MPRGRDPGRRHGAGNVGPGRHARARQALRSRPLEHRATRGPGLSHGIQSVACARVGRRVNSKPHHEWLSVHHGNAPLVVSFPHTGTEIPERLESHLVSPWLAQKDTDYWVDVLYDFAHEMGATTIRTALSRTVIDVNRDPSGASLYPGQATTGLCPTETFAGDPLYREGEEPGPSEIDERREKFFVPYHAALLAEICRLRGLHERIVLYDCHSIRSVLPRLFEGT